MSQLWNGLWSLAVVGIGALLVLDWLRACGVVQLHAWTGRTTLYAGGGSRADRGECTQVFVLALGFRVAVFAVVVVRFLVLGARAHFRSPFAAFVVLYLVGGMIQFKGGELLVGFALAGLVAFGYDMLRERA